MASTPMKSNKKNNHNKKNKGLKSSPVANTPIMARCVALALPHLLGAASLPSRCCVVARAVAVSLFLKWQRGRLRAG